MNAPHAPFLCPHGALALALLAFTFQSRADAGSSCEQAVAASLERLRGVPAAAVAFAEGGRTFEVSGDDTAVRGAGRYRRTDGAAVPFSYGCTFNSRSGAASGVLLHEAAEAVDTAVAPDLSHVSPQACESAAAAALTQRHPRVARIAFDADTRRLHSPSKVRLALEGTGAVERAPGMQSAPFRYRCEIDARDGRVLSVRADEAEVR